MKELIIEYIEQHKEVYIQSLIVDSNLSTKSKSILIENNILSIYELLTIPKATSKLISAISSDSAEEIADYIFSIHSGIIDELDSFPELEEWNMFLDAINEIMSLDPLKCALCMERKAAFSMNIANQRYINICEVCAERIKVPISDFLISKGLF